MPARVHARGRAQRADDPDHRVGHQRGPAPTARLARRGLRPDHGRQRRRPLPDRGTAFFETVDALIGSGASRRQAHRRADRERTDRHDRTGHPRTAPTAWRSSSRSTTSARATPRSVYLQRLPVVEIKADRSFVTPMCTVKDDAVDRPLDHRSRPQPRREGRRRRRRGQGDDRPAQRIRLRRGPGLLLQPPDAGRCPRAIPRDVGVRSAATRRRFRDERDERVNPQPSGQTWMA